MKYSPMHGPSRDPGLCQAFRYVGSPWSTKLESNCSKWGPMRAGLLCLPANPIPPSRDRTAFFGRLDDPGGIRGPVMVSAGLEASLMQCFNGPDLRATGAVPVGHFIYPQSPGWVPRAGLGWCCSCGPGPQREQVPSNGLPS